MKYIVLTAKSTFDVEKVANAYIKHRLILTGGINIQGQYNVLYYQAMIK